MIVNPHLLRHSEETALQTRGRPSMGTKLDFLRLCAGIDPPPRYNKRGGKAARTWCRGVRGFASFRLDAGFLRFLAPLCDLASDEIRELIWTQWRHAQAYRLKPRSDVLLGYDFRGRLVELVDNFPRRSGRGYEPEPNDRLEPG